jgi:hypothetical protein
MAAKILCAAAGFCFACSLCNGAPLAALRSTARNGSHTQSLSDAMSSMCGESGGGGSYDAVVGMMFPNDLHISTACKQSIADLKTINNAGNDLVRRSRILSIN